MADRLWRGGEVFLSLGITLLGEEILGSLQTELRIDEFQELCCVNS